MGGLNRLNHEPEANLKYAALVKAIHSANAQLQGRAAMAVNQALVLRNWLVGEWIVEFQQHGKDRAKYGTKLLETLATDLKKQEIKGFTAAVLRQCRLFRTVYPQIRQTVSAESPTPLPPETLLRLSWSHLQELIAIDDPWKNVKTQEWRRVRLRKLNFGVISAAKMQEVVHVE